MNKLALPALSTIACLCLSCAWNVPILCADDGAPAEDDLNFDLADGRFLLTAPEGWLRKKPATRIVEHEFQVPASDGDERPGRVTVTGAGGSVEDNINRWIGQFSQPDKSSTNEKTKREKLTVAGQEITLIDVSGTYDDRPPAAAGGIKRENYRMLAAIVVTKQGEKKTGNYFVKFVGPSQTVEDHAEGFKKMIEGLKAAK
ncbi:MAG TPA: hypothetical protein VGX78_02695 [Pirellulales bacterium]|jgi:hypothetical protein|nr:hypothetical protein [Pirellulales bacterium]